MKTKEKFQKYDLSLSKLTIGGLNYLQDTLEAALEDFFLYLEKNPALINYYDQQLSDQLKIASYEYFREIKETSETASPNKGQMADLYFENFTPIWDLSDKRNKNLFFVLYKMVEKWEEENNFLLHKGTLFYFWAVTDIVHGDYAEGFIMMHKALEEDIKLANGVIPNSPAHKFISINSEPGAYLDRLTLNIKDFLERRLKKYQLSTEGKLTYDLLQKKILNSSSPEYLEIKFFFSYITLRWIRLRLIHKERVADKTMSPLILTGVIFDLLLISDALLKIAYQKDYLKKKNVYFSNHLLITAQKQGWTKEKDFSKYIKNYGVDINSEIKNNFEGIIKSLLAGEFLGKKITRLEADFLLSYCLRNYYAHTIKSQEILWKEFTSVLQSILDVIFFAVEII
ncbi:MAG: hypothetical protein M1355_02910 [Patescibacteria group bacterium]|nr:hypothetical protein [Patescibacteria group bacterium]